MFDAIIPDAWTHMLYIAAETVRDRTVLELREFQPTWIACAIFPVKIDTTRHLRCTYRLENLVAD